MRALGGRSLGAVPKGFSKSISPAPWKSCQCLQCALLAEPEFVPSLLPARWERREGFPPTCWHLPKYHDTMVFCFQKTHQLQAKNQGN